MRFSIIIPTHNAQGTLKLCLNSIYSSENKDFEVIVVDSKCTDKSAEIAKVYPCKIITLEKNKGAGHARNIGSDNAKGELLVFVDSDIMIKKETLNIINESFEKNKDIVATTCILSKECPHKNFFTQYKNLYMHYIYKKCPEYVDFLYGSLMAIGRNDFLKFNENIKMEDTELGQRYEKLNKKILLNPDLKVTHLKKYNLRSIIKNDFLVPFWWVKSLLLHNSHENLFKKMRFSHARADQIIGIVVSYLIIISLLFLEYQSVKITLSYLVFAYLFLNHKFFIFLFREKGVLFSLQSIIFTYFDTVTMGLGVAAGFLRFGILSSRK